ncbi:MAG: flap endonuclease, partial [Candidatus Nanopelagicales bacterium]|nr:flap endonuclease [Candidatus Nanopelagicales bacterium]
MSHKFNTLAVDLSSLAYRSYFGLPDSIKSTDGKPVNAIKGYLDALNRFIKMYEPKNIIHATDEDWRPQWRVDLLPEYKAHRVEDETKEIVPDDLDFQLNLLPEILADMGMNVIGIEKAEADDVLATISFNSESVVLITGDRDLLQ